MTTRTTPTLRWADVSARQDRNNLPYYAIMGIADGTLDRRDWGIAVADAWVGAEWPTSAVDGDLAIWETIFEWAVDGDGYLNDDGTVTSPTTLPESITLYRGATPERATGLSWTANRATAEWFATRLGQAGRVYEITISPESVLAVFHGRSEAEYVVAVSSLFEDDVQEVD